MPPLLGSTKDLDHLSLLQNIIFVYYIVDVMGIGPREQKVATTMDSLAAHAFKRMEISPQNSRNMYLSKIPRRSVVWDMQRYSF